MQRSRWLLVAWILVGVYASAIFALSSLSNPCVPTWGIPHIDKLYHLIEYAVLAFVLLHALRLTFRTHPMTPLLLSGIALTVCYGISDELHQAFVPGRVMSVFDLSADAVGASAVGLAWLLIQRRWPMIVHSAGEE